MPKIYVFAAVALLFLSCKSSDKADFEVCNATGVEQCRMVEVDSFPTTEFILRDEAGKEVPYQLTHDKKLIFAATVPAESSAAYYFEAGTPSKVDTLCYGRIFPERMDDLAWENDRTAYRAYGPALQASGERAYGYDVWTKSVRNPILEKRFHNHIIRNISYHVDHGEGMDVYGVGPTLGGGTSAILAPGDSIVYPYCWESAEVLDNGPLRFSARLTYPPCVLYGDTIVETRIITLDAGSWLNKTTVCFENMGENLRPMVGAVVHGANPDGYTLGDNCVSYCDLTQQPDGDNGEIYLTLYSPELTDARYLPLVQKEGDAVGHIILAGKPGLNNFTYYWGSGWSKGGIDSFEDWNKTVACSVAGISNPLTVKYQ